MFTMSSADQTLLEDTTMTKNKMLKSIKMWSKIALASLTYAVAVELFLFPSTVVVGGATGLATLLDIFLTDSIWLSTGVFVLAINIPVLIYCYAVHHRRLAIKTTGYVTLLALFLILLRVFDLGATVHTLLGGDSASNKMLYTLVGGALSGLSLPIMLSVGGSTGGSDIAGMVLQRSKKFSSTDSIRAIFFANIGLLFGGSVVMYFVSGMESAINLFIYSTVGIVVNEIVHERVFHGFSSAIEIEITTTKPQEMADALMDKLKHSVTFVKAVGGYTGTEKTIVLCVIYKRQLTLARRIISRIDDKAFAYVENVREVIGLGFANKEDHLVEEKDSAEQ